MNDVRLSALADHLHSLDSPDASALQLVRTEVIELKNLLEKLLHRELADFLGAADTMIRSIGVLEGEAFAQMRGLVVTLLTVVADEVTALGLQSTGESSLTMQGESQPAACGTVPGALPSRESAPLELENESSVLSYGGLHTMTELLLGQILLEDGVLTRAQLVEALKLQSRDQVRIGEAIVTLGFVSPENVKGALGRQAKLVEEWNRANDSGQVALLHDLTIGEILKRIGGVSQDDINRGLQVHRAAGKRLGEALVELGVVSWERVEEAVRIQAKSRTNSSWGPPSAKGLSLRLGE